MRAADGGFPTAEEHEAMIQRALAIAREARVPLGMHVMDPASALARAAEGMQFIAVASDLRMLTACAQDFVATIWPDRSDKEISRY
jgi:2-keto-3-deoxy-L-rhamnonate aldolase RhmA